MNYSKETTHHGINMTLIGSWIDLAAYYAGSDGNVWTYQPTLGWSNTAESSDFVRRMRRKFYRGNLFLSRCPGCGCQKAILPGHVVCVDCESIPVSEPQPDHIKYAENPPL